VKLLVNLFAQTRFCQARTTPSRRSAGTQQHQHKAFKNIAITTTGRVKSTINIAIYKAAEF